jgi:hypothetical protein
MNACSAPPTFAEAKRVGIVSSAVRLEPAAHVMTPLTSVHGLPLPGIRSSRSKPSPRCERGRHKRLWLRRQRLQGDRERRVGLRSSVLIWRSNVGEYHSNVPTGFKDCDGMVGIGGLDHIVTRLLDDFRRAHADQTFILHDEDNGAIGAAWDIRCYLSGSPTSDGPFLFHSINDLLS